MRKGNIDAWQKHQLVASPTRTQPTTQACALTDSPPGDLLVCRLTPNQQCNTAQGDFCVLFDIGIFSFIHSMFLTPNSRY